MQYCMQVVDRANSLFYCSHPYNCNIFMQDLQVGGISAVYQFTLRLACWCTATTMAKYFKCRILCLQK